MNDRDVDRLDQILELIDHIDRRMDGMSREDFLADRDEVDLTAFRLAAIGEATRKLSDELKSRHPRIGWAAIYGMRNIIAHDYGAINPERVWQVLGDDLEALAIVCRQEISD